MNPTMIRLFLPVGDAKRLRTAEISNWSGQAVAAPRLDFDLLLEREKLARPGIYVLLGEPTGSKSAGAYIGESEDVAERLIAHSESDFWTHSFVFTDKGESLTKAHVRYLEARVIEEARKARRYDVQNTMCSRPKLPESDRGTVEVFFAHARQLMPVIGCDLLVPTEAAKPEHPPSPRPEDIRKALQGVTADLSPRYLELLRAHYRAPEQKLTARQMAAAVQYASYAAANLHYGKLGRLVGEALGFPAEDCHVGVLVNFIKPRTEGNAEWIWTLRPEIAEAIKTLGWV